MQAEAMDVVDGVLEVLGFVRHPAPNDPKSFWTALAIAIHKDAGKHEDMQSRVVGELVCKPHLYQHLVQDTESGDMYVLRVVHKARTGSGGPLELQAAVNTTQLHAQVIDVLPDGSHNVHDYTPVEPPEHLTPIWLVKYNQASWDCVIPASMENSQHSESDMGAVEEEDLQARWRAEVAQLQEELAQERAARLSAELRADQNELDLVTDELANTHIELHGEVKPFHERCNVPIPDLQRANREESSTIVSGPEQHLKTDVMSGICAVNACKLGQRAPTVVIQKDVVPNVDATREKMGRVLQHLPVHVSTVYVSGKRGLCKLLQDEDCMNRFLRGLLVPVMPAYAGALEGLNNAIIEYNLRGINVIIDEADALARTYVNFKAVQSEEELYRLELTKFEQQLYRLFGTPQQDAAGRLCGFKLHPECGVRSIFWVSATHLPTMFAHAMWGMPIKYVSMDLELLAQRQFSSYQHLTPLKNEEGNDVFVEADEYRDVSRLLGPKAELMFKTFVDDVVKPGPPGYRGDRCMLQVSVTRAVNAGDNSTLNVIHRSLELYHKYGDPVNAPEPTIVVVVGAGTVVVPSDETPEVPVEINASIVQRHKLVEEPPSAAGGASQDRVQQAATTGNASTASGSRSVSETLQRPGSGSSPRAAGLGWKRSRGARPRRMKAHEVMAMIERTARYAGRPIIVIGLRCMGRSVSMRGSFYVITHVIATPGQRITSADLSQLLMRCGGDTRRVREQLNKFMGGVKVLIQEEDYHMLQELYPFTQELGQRLAALDRPLTLEDFSQQVRAICTERPDAYLAVRSSKRPHVTRRLDPHGILANAFEPEQESEEESEQESEEESEEEFSSDEEEDEQFSPLQARRRLGFSRTTLPQPRNQAGPSGTAGPSSQQQQGVNMMGQRPGNTVDGVAQDAVDHAAAVNAVYQQCRRAFGLD